MNAVPHFDVIAPVRVPDDGMLLSLWRGMIPAPMNATMRSIAQRTTEDHGIPFHQLFSPSRNRRVVFARWDFMWRCRQAKKPGEYYRFSFPQIGAFLDLHHTSVLHGVREWEKIMRGERK